MCNYTPMFYVDINIYACTKPDAGLQRRSQHLKRFTRGIPNDATPPVIYWFGDHICYGLFHCSTILIGQCLSTWCKSAGSLFFKSGNNFFNFRNIIFPQVTKINSHHGAHGSRISLGRFCRVHRHPSDISRNRDIFCVCWWRPEIHGRVSHGQSEFENCSSGAQSPCEFCECLWNSGKSCRNVRSRDTVQVRRGFIKQGSCQGPLSLRFI